MQSIEKMEDEKVVHSVMSVKKIVGRKLSRSNRLLVKEAISRGVEVEKLPKKRFRLTYGNKSYVIRRGRVSNAYNSRLTKRCVDLKEVTSRLLRNKGFPAPENGVFPSEELQRAWNWAEPILPVVLKPHSGSMGRLVFVNIKDYDEFRACFNRIAEKHDEVLIERFVEGKEYRFTYIKKEIVGVTHRRPANITGDGESTVEQLVEEKNNERKRRENPIHKCLHIDDEAIRVMSKDGFNPQSIPEKGEIVYLRNNSNISTGGDAIDVTDDIGQETKDLVAKAASSIPGLRACGIDVIINNDSIYILEINAHPMFSMHHYPWEGKPRNVVGKVIEAMFPALTKE